MRWFNTTGPCVPADHYIMPASAHLPQLSRHIERGQYAVVHAARQSGKTTALLRLTEELTREGRYAAILLSVEVGATFREVEQAELPILGAWRLHASLALPPALHPLPWPEAAPGERILAGLSAWAQACPRPLVLFLDEVDALQDDVLLSFLRQLRQRFNSGFADFRLR